MCVCMVVLMRCVQGLAATGCVAIMQRTFLTGVILVVVVCTTSDLVVWCVVQSCGMDACLHAAPLRGAPAVVVLQACSRLGW